MPDQKARDVADGLPLPGRSVAIAAISCGIALVVLDGSIATVALPTIARELGVDDASAVLVVTIYQLVLVVTLLPLSAVGDRIGHRRLYQCGLLLFAFASVLALFTQSLPMLLVCRSLQALGAAAVLSVSAAMVRSIYPARMLGRGLGLQSIVVSSSMALAPTLGGGILAVADWRWVFAAAAPFGLLSLMFARTLPNAPRYREPFDFLAASLCAVTFGLVIGGFESGLQGSSVPAAVILLAAGVIVGIVFVRHELREERPILPVDLLAKPVFAFSIVGSLTAFLASMILLLSIPFRLQHGYGFTPSEVGGMIAAWPLTTLIVAPVAGALSDRIHAGVLGGIGMGIATLGFLAFVFLPAQPAFADVAARMAFCGMGFGLFLSPNTRLILGSAPRERAASVGSLISTTRLVGQTLGATIAGALLAVGLGDGFMPAMAAASCSFVAGLCSVARLKPAGRQTKQAEIEAADPGAPH